MQMVNMAYYGNYMVYHVFKTVNHGKMWLFSESHDFLNVSSLIP